MMFVMIALVVVGLLLFVWGGLSSPCLCPLFSSTRGLPAGCSLSSRPRLVVLRWSLVLDVLCLVLFSLVFLPRMDGLSINILSAWFQNFAQWCLRRPLLSDSGVVFSMDCCRRPCLLSESLSDGNFWRGDGIDQCFSSVEKFSSPLQSCSFLLLCRLRHVRQWWWPSSRPLSVK